MVNMAHLLAPPQQKLQLNYITIITHNYQKMDLYGSQTTKELKKSHSFRLRGGTETRGCGAGGAILTYGGQQLGRILRSEGSQHHTRPPNPEIKCQEDKSL